MSDPAVTEAVAAPEPDPVDPLWQKVFSHAESCLAAALKVSAALAELEATGQAAEAVASWSVRRRRHTWALFWETTDALNAAETVLNRALALTQPKGA